MDKIGFIPSPEEQKMMAMMRRLEQMGNAIEDFNPADPVKLLFVGPEKKPDEKPRVKVKESSFPGEFTPLRISGEHST